MLTDVLLEDCHLFDSVSGTLVADAAVWVHGDRVGAAGPAHVVRAAAPDEVRTVGLDGGYLLPGLLNMHTHLSLSLPGDAGARVEAMSPHRLALYMASGAERTLLAGVTTVRCVAEKDGADFALRAAIEAGEVRGPRIYTAGKALCSTGGHGSGSSDTMECDGADGFRRGVRSQLKAGADLIKVMTSGGIAGERERISEPQLADDELAAVVTTAHALGAKVTAHAGPAAVIERAVALGLDCVEHGYQLTREVAAAMAGSRTALVPTLVVTRCEDFFASLGVPAWMRERSATAAEEHEESYGMALDAGVEVMLGSDMPPFWPFDGTTATVRELEHMADLGADHGMTPARALQAATVVPARWLGAEDLVGSAEPGRFADLIVVDEDPTLDVTALRTLRWVMKGGHVVRDDRA